MMTQQKTVLVAPLNWGLGHATRMIPVIELLLQKGGRVLLAADKRPYDLLKSRFPGCEMIRLPGFEPAYPKKDTMMAMRMLLSFPLMLKKAHEAGKKLEEIVIKHRVDIIISDNRYEVHAKNTYNVFITHQLNVQTSGWQHLFKPLIRQIIYKYIRKFDELWIPDVADEQINLSGKLSHVKKYPVKNYHFTGPLSRFQSDTGAPLAEKPGLLAIVSGPEPQRTVFEQLLTKQLFENNQKATLVLGKPEEKTIKKSGNLTLISHADDEQLASLIQSADTIICRPGYSTIMDLSVFGKKAIFVPTPGQTEQMYLARQLKKKGICHCEEQDKFNLRRAMEASSNYSGLPLTKTDGKTDILIENILQDYNNPKS